MYTQHFNLSAPPFQLTPDPRFLFESSVHARAIAHLQYGLQQGEGFIVVTGEVGAGKTTIIGHLVDSLDRHKYVATTVVTTNINPDDIIRMIVHGLGLPHEGKDKAHLLLDLEAYLHDCVRRNKRCLIFVDEAQNLDIPTLEELRMLSNIHVNGIAPVQLFLLGQPQFRAVLSQPDLRQLRQRVIASYHLGPLDAEETKEYVLHRLQRVGWSGENPAIRENAFPIIYKFTEGVPRRINTLCSRILLFCCLEDSNIIDFETVELVAQDLEEEFAQVLDQDGPTTVVNDDIAPAPAAPSQDPAPAVYQETAQNIATPEQDPGPIVLQPDSAPQPEISVTYQPIVTAPAAPETADVADTPNAAEMTSETQPDSEPASSSINTPPANLSDAATAALSNIASQLMTPNTEKELTPEGWQEVFDIIESAPIETLAALGQAQAENPEIKAETEVQANIGAATATAALQKAAADHDSNKPHNKMFKRLLLLILEEYLKGRPDNPSNKSRVQHAHSR